MTSLRPSTADNTEIAGVIMESPMNIEAPTTPSASNGQAPPAQRPLPQRHQGQRTSLAVVVGAQQQQHIFGGHDDEQRPQDQREHAEHDGARHRRPIRRVRDGLAKRIQRRRADIAEHDADASQRQGPKA